MLTKIQKWGNSQGFRIPKEILHSAHIGIGDSVDVSVDDGKIIVVATERVRGRFNISELVKGRIEKDGEDDFGAPIGNEVW